MCKNNDIYDYEEYEDGDGKTVISYCEPSLDYYGMDMYIEDMLEKSGLNKLRELLEQNSPIEDSGE